jgi:4a-hydroxytetrahydrobiopterin dehydratase
MTSRQRLAEAQITEQLASLDGWTLTEGKIRKSYRFRDFSEAFGWMTRAAMAAEKRDHHPDWSNCWATVIVEFSTHDAGGLTTADFEMAKEFDRLLPR